MMDFSALLQNQRAYFRTGATAAPASRKAALHTLYTLIDQNRAAIAHALGQDLGKSETESYLCEIGLTLREIRFLMGHVGRWARPRRCRTDLANFPGRSFTVSEPYGCVLVMAPWNYPFLLCMEPLAGAIAAGNCCIVN
ncbi:MAG: aldehyde dehydrogenase family protein [Eubacteriales bacterium]|nr:aldehyde dehydrogenase family protein [Eubacteriales bacterium]